MSTRRPNRSVTPAAASASRQRLRVIGGRWRGRPITFPPVEAIRPSPDRVRETLFNWLQAHVPNARCLDLFAGSGALGIEALSRGAAQVTFVERDLQVVRHLRSTLQYFGVSEPQVEVADARQFLRRPGVPHDIVFLDPPFATELLRDTCAQLAGGGWLAPHAFIYVECPTDVALDFLPAGWSQHRSGRAGQVGYHLLRAPSAQRTAS